MATVNAAVCWNTLRAYRHHNVAGDGKRDGLKSLRIGQSAGNPSKCSGVLNEYEQRASEGAKMYSGLTRERKSQSEMVGRHQVAMVSNPQAG